MSTVPLLTPEEDDLDEASPPSTPTSSILKIGQTVLSDTTESSRIDGIEPTSLQSAPGDKDKAAHLLKASKPVTVSPEENKRILGRIDRRILPILLIVYCLQSLDKSTLAYASVFGLLDDAHLHGEDYSWLGSIVYLAQLVMQPAVAYFLVKLPTGRFTAIMVLCWGVTLCCMTAAHNFVGLLILRFFLGAFEAAVAPAFIAIVQMWYRRNEQTNRIAAWYAMNGVVHMVGSLLTYGLGHIKSRLHSYQIIFLFCGCLTVALSIIVFAFMPDSPMTARFLSPKDKLIAIERLRMNQMGISSQVWKWSHVRESLGDLKTWLWFSLLFSISVISGGLGTFGPLIIKAFGFNAFSTILFNIPFGAIQLIATLGGAWLATYLKTKSRVLILLCLPPIAGIAVLLATEHSKTNREMLLAAYYLTSFYPGITPLIFSWSGQNTAGDTKRKVTTGILFVGASAGNIVGPHLYTTAEAPRYYRGLVSNIGLFIVVVALVALGSVWLAVLNQRHARMRERLGKSAVVVDWSMEDGGGFERQQHIGEDAGEDTVGDRAFDDEGDLENEDFIYVY